MSRHTSFLRAYKGPAILAASAVTLIAALAIPRATLDSPVNEPAALEITSRWNAEVKRADVMVGGYVAPGNTILVLTDPELEKQISQLEDELQLALLETKEVVVEPGSMMGMIGSLPRVVWETPKAPPISGDIEKNAASEPAPPSKELAGLEKDVKGLNGKEGDVEASIEARNAELQDASVSVTLAEGNLVSIQTGQDAANKQLERMQKLYDIGAIAKRKLDDAVSASEQANRETAEAKNKLDEAKARQASLEKQLADLKADLAKLNAQLEELRGKLDVEKSKAAEVKPQPQTQAKPAPLPKPVRRLVYGTAPEESNAPLQVKLVDSEEPGEEQKIEAIRTKLLELKAKREDLKVKATQAGRIVWLAEPGSKVSPSAKLVVIQPSKS